MQIKTSTFSSIGSSHKDNQDYSICGSDYVILSDGCSSVGFLSSVGARILTHSVETLRPHDKSGWNAVLQNCETIVGRLNLPVDCLCATLMWLEYFEDAGYVELTMIGDGTYAWRDRNTGKISTETIRFKSGAPYYLRYELGVREGYIEQFGDIYNDDRSYFKDFPNGIITKRFDVADIDMVAVFSDGVGSFVRGSLEGLINQQETLLSIEEVVCEFLSIKGFAGDFMHRRGNVAMNKFGAEGHKPYDDFSVGVMKL